MVKKATASSTSSTHTGAPYSAVKPGRIGRLAALAGHFKHVKSTVVAIAGVGAVASSLVGYYSTYKTVTLATNAVSASSATADPLSILVLPFVNQTGDTQKAYIADALTTSLTADLARIQNRMSAYMARNRNRRFHSFTKRSVSTPSIRRKPTTSSWRAHMPCWATMMPPSPRA